MRGRIALQKHCVQNAQEVLSYFAQALGVRTRPRVAFQGDGLANVQGASRSIDHVPFACRV